MTKKYTFNDNDMLVEKQAMKNDAKYDEMKERQWKEWVDFSEIDHEEEAKKAKQIRRTKKWHYFLGGLGLGLFIGIIAGLAFRSWIIAEMLSICVGKI